MACNDPAKSTNRSKCVLAMSSTWIWSERVGEGKLSAFPVSRSHCGSSPLRDRVGCEPAIGRERPWRARGRGREIEGSIDDAGPPAAGRRMSPRVRTREFLATIAGRGVTAHRLYRRMSRDIGDRPGSPFYLSFWRACVRIEEEREIMEREVASLCVSTTMKSRRGQRRVSSSGRDQIPRTSIVRVSVKGNDKFGISCS